MVTAPFNAEAERAAAEAMHDAWCMEGGACPTRDRHVAVTRRDAARVLAAVVPILAEHFAQAVEAIKDECTSSTQPCFCGGVDLAAARIREAATPTEGDQA